MHGAWAEGSLRNARAPPPPTCLLPVRRTRRGSTAAPLSCSHANRPRSASVPNCGAWSLADASHCEKRLGKTAVGCCYLVSPGAA